MGGIRLRPLRLEDAKIIILWRADPSFRDPLLGYRFPVTDVMEDAWVAAALNDQSRTRVVLAIEDGTDRLIGLVQLMNIDWIDRTAELAVGLGEARDRGHGSGEAATRLILTEAFTTFDLRRIFVRVASFNQPARRLFEKIGFQHEGTLRQHVVRQGAAHDVLLYGILDTEATEYVFPESGVG